MKKPKDDQKKEEKSTKSEKKHIDEKEQKINDLTDCVQRLQAEFENYRKRVEKESAEFVNYANAQLIGELLPLMDAFELALKNKENKEDFIKGVELIFAQLFDKGDSLDPSVKDRVEQVVSALVDWTRKIKEK